MVAYACSPIKQGEHLLGWEWVSRIAKRHKVTVLTRSSHLTHSDKLRPANLRMLGVNDRWFSFLRKFGWPGLSLYYWVWQMEAARLGRRLLATEKFNIIHQCTFHTFRIPGRLASSEGPPFIWGPIAGLESVPLGMWPVLGSNVFRESFRFLSNLIMPRLPLIKRTLKNSFAILVSNQESLAKLSAVHPRSYELFPANAVRIPQVAKYDPGEGVLKVLAAGSMVRIRAYDLVLKAISELPVRYRTPISLTFLGDGPDLKRLRRKVRILNLEKNVSFLGKKTRQETIAFMATANLLVFPSLRDSGGSVVAEAMAMGLPVLSFRLGGPASMLEAGGGFLIEADSPKKVAGRIGNKLVSILEQRSLLLEESSRGRTNARRLFSWDDRIARVEKIYQSACGIGRPKRS